MLFSLYYIAKITIILEIIINITDITYFGYDRRRILYNFIWGIIWVSIINWQAATLGYFLWVLIVAIFIFRMSKLIMEKKKLDENNKK
jgi:hypothetical protein